MPMPNSQPLHRNRSPTPALCIKRRSSCSTGQTSASIPEIRSSPSCDFTPRLTSTNCETAATSPEWCRLQANYPTAAGAGGGLPSIGVGGQLLLRQPTAIQPTIYRFAALIERAKQLVQIAAQIEAAFLSALEKRDKEAYDLIVARGSLELAQAGISLKDLQVSEAQGSVTLAALQKNRAQIQYDHFEQLLAAPLLQTEQDALMDIKQARDWTVASAWVSGAGVVAAAVAGMAAGGVFGTVVEPGGGTAAGAAVGGTVGAIAGAVAQGLGPAAQSLQAIASVRSYMSNYNTMLATFERRREDWDFQAKLSYNDILFGDQQITIAVDHVQVVEKERAIETLRASQAREQFNFLTQKFTGKELYEWMSGVLEHVYSYFLQQATTVAQMAADQLAFERQEPLQTIIQADYWEMPSEDNLPAMQGSIGADRRGLTGSARLLQDIYRLDEYAFETTKIKLQLTRTISLAQLDPYVFQRFRETGVMIFATPMALFDRDFPGHFLRLIKRVRTSVVALIPPNEGIRATLSTSGISRVVVGGDVFQGVVVRRDPETVALTSPINATGVFELESDPKLSLPFEWTGVDTTWEFSLPKASNPFDFRSIADVLITIEYTALNSLDYRQQVIQQLDRSFSIDRSFSFRQQFADQWYDLHNPDQSPAPMKVRFETAREDFPPNLDDIRIQQVVLYFARQGAFEVPVTGLHLSPPEGGSVGGGATSIDGVISTRRGNAGSWNAMIGKAPTGKWDLALPDTDELKGRLQREEIDDILFVLTCSGTTPPWPN